MKHKQDALDFRNIWAAVVCLNLVCSNISSAWADLGEQSSSSVANLEDYDRMSFEKVLALEPKGLMAYYLEGTERSAVALDLVTLVVRHGERASKNSFLCLLAENGIGRSDDTGETIVKAPVKVSSCRSRSGRYDVLGLDIEAARLFNDDLSLSEIDASKALKSGSNIYIDDLYRPTTPRLINEEFLEGQRFGGGDYIARCSSLHLTAKDGIGLVSIYRTTVRPHFAGALQASNTGKALGTALASGLHLRVAKDIGFKCEQAALLSSGIVLILSDNKLVAIDRYRKRYGELQLSGKRSSLLIFREMNGRAGLSTTPSQQ